jgi:hypothetical protein
LPFVRRSSIVVIVRSAMLMPVEKIKKVINVQRRSKRMIDGKAIFVAKSEFETQGVCVCVCVCKSPCALNPNLVNHFAALYFIEDTIYFYIGREVI